MPSECESCFQQISTDRRLCDACMSDMQAALDEVGEAERVFRERQQRAACTE